MAKERKLMCDCGSILTQQITKFGELETEAMVCPKCGFTTLTKDQAENYIKLKQLHQIIDKERKIIQIGNSFGLTLPEGLKGIGMKVGKKVRTEALGPKSFKVELID